MKEAIKGVVTEQNHGRRIVIALLSLNVESYHHNRFETIVTESLRCKNSVEQS